MKMFVGENVPLISSDSGCRDVAVARLDGFLRGLSFLNPDFRHNFAEAFFVANDKDASTPNEALMDHFSKQMIIEFIKEKRIKNWVPEVESDLPALLHDQNTDLRSYVSYKVMELLLDAVNSSEEIDVVRLNAEVDKSSVKLSFFCFRLKQRYLVLYFVRDNKFIRS